MTWRPASVLAAVLLALAPGPAAAFQPDCMDGLDNDGDGSVDHPLDPSCTGPMDTETPDCGDGLDNDWDGRADGADAGCRSPWDESEEPDCSDGRDADRDGDLDWPEDRGCSSPWDGTEREEAGALQQCLIAACVDLRAPAPLCPGILPPTDLTARMMFGGVLLDWEPPLAGSPVGYTVYRGIGVDPIFVEATLEPIGSTLAEFTEFLDNTADPRVSYVYWVTANGPGCESPPSNPAASGFPPNLFHCINPDLESMPPFYLAPDCITLGGL